MFLSSLAHNVAYHYAESHCAELGYAECHNAGFGYAEVVMLSVLC